MAQPNDLQRLLSWLKTSEFKYREFAEAREVSDAVASWPVLHEVAAATGQPVAVVAPEGDRVAKERIARAELAIPATEPASIAAEDAGLQASESESEALGMALRQRLGAARSGQMAATASTPAETAPYLPSTVAADTVSRGPVAELVEPWEPTPQTAGGASKTREGESVVFEAAPGSRSPAFAARYGLFLGGVYHPASRRATDAVSHDSRDDTSLQAVFSRLSGHYDRQEQTSATSLGRRH